MSDIPQTGPVQSPERESQNPDILALQGKLKDLGFWDIWADILERISKDAEEKAGFSNDLENISAKAPNNENEKSFIETKYLKGFWQMVMFQWKEVSVAEVAKMIEGMSPDEKKKAIDGMDDTTADLYEKYIDWKTASNSKMLEKEKWVKQLANQDIVNIKDANENKKVELDLMDKKLRPQIAELQKIDWVPKPDIWELQKSAQEVPELKGKNISEEDLKNGKYDNILIANFYLTNASDIYKKVKPEDHEKFVNSMKGVSDIMGRQRPVDWPGVTQELAFGSARGKIKDTGDKIVADGYNKEVIWDPQTRSLIFRGDKWEKAIDTAYVPPRERIIRGNLSISREIPTITPAQKEKQSLQWETSKLIIQVSKDFSEVRLVNPTWIPEAITVNSSTILDEYKDAQWLFESAPNPEQKLQTLKNLKEKNGLLEQVRRQSMTTENMSDPRYTELESSLHVELGSLTKLEWSLGEFLQVQKKLSGYNTTPPIAGNTRFDEVANANLTWLTTNYFDRMGPNAQRGIERMVDWINRTRDARNQIQLDGHEFTQEERWVLLQSLESLWWDRATLTDGEKLPVFQAKINEAITKAPGDSASIESLMKIDTAKKEV